MKCLSFLSISFKQSTINQPLILTVATCVEIASAFQSSSIIFSGMLLNIEVSVLTVCKSKDVQSSNFNLTINLSFITYINFNSISRKLAKKTQI